MALYDAGEMRIVDGLGPAAPPSRYAGRRQVSWPALAAIAGMHALLAVTLDLAGMLPMRRVPSELKLINLSPEMAPPPPVVSPKLPDTIQPRRVELAKVQPVEPLLDAPAPIVTAPVPAPVLVSPSPPAPPPQAPVPSGPVRVSDLDAKAVTIVPPKYPIESRRRREQGTVVLSVTLGTDGSVDAVEVARSSGFERLDRAALDAVRRWRWSPTLRDGVAVAVRGTVDIPFILQG